MTRPTPLPPTFDKAQLHGVLPSVDHDEAARMNFCSSISAFVNTQLSPGVKLAFEKHVRPAAEAQGAALHSATDIRDAMLGHPFYQTWAALRRNNQEVAKQIALEIAVQRKDEVNARTRAFNAGKNTLALDPAVVPPVYISQVENHCAPGGYFQQLAPEDVTVAAAYEVGLWPVGMGSLGPAGEGGGRAAVKWIRERFPDFRPKRILDLGAGCGSNTLPLADGFPDAEVVAMDASEPLMRYGHARAQAMGYGSVRFVQATIETLDPAVHGTFDWVHTTMVWHETSASALREGLKRIHAILNPGGVTTHFEQPNFTPETALFDQFLRDWDAWYNNEPFWSKLHRMDMTEELVAAGFAREKIIDGSAPPVIPPGAYPAWAGLTSRHEHEVKSAAATQAAAAAAKPMGPGSYDGKGWYVFGAVKDL
ncbi:MAG: class I SAM-dependent methyltransferase [Rhodospirillaceae bacterium]|nr:class I SAM-dependent methyltransferase [Rhodospirillaceae bacterium]